MGKVQALKLISHEPYKYQFALKMFWEHYMLLAVVSVLNPFYVVCDCKKSAFLVCDSFEDLSKVYRDRVKWTAIRVENDNRDISSLKFELRWGFFINYFTNLKILVVIGQLRAIDTHYCKPPTLEYIFLHENNLTKIERRTFYNFRKLEKLSLQNNAIEEINADAFDNSRIQGLDLSHNKLNVLKTNTFRKCEMEELNVSNNQLKFIQINSLPVRLTRLYLDNNAFDEMPQLNNLVQLQELTLKNNDIYKISNLKGLGSLKVLDLSFNKIRSVGQQLNRLTKLRHLDLSHNRLTRFQLNNFDSNHTKIFLAFNRLPYLNLTNITNKRILLTLFGNPWRCNCLREMEALIDQSRYIWLSLCDTKLFSSGQTPICVVDAPGEACSTTKIRTKALKQFESAIAKLECDIYGLLPDIGPCFYS